MDRRVGRCMDGWTDTVCGGGRVVVGTYFSVQLESESSWVLDQQVTNVCSRS